MELNISNIGLIGMASVWRIPLWLVGLVVLIALAIFLLFLLCSGNVFFRKKYESTK